MKALFVSDVHLRDPDELRTQIMVRFLKTKGFQFDRIYILGDFFDAWPITSKFLIERFSKVLDILKRLATSCEAVYYFEGNHDFHLGKYFSSELGIRVVTNSAVHEFGNRKVFIAHGDLGNPNEKAYRMLRGALRNPVVFSALRLLPGPFLYHGGDWASRMSRKFSEETPDKTEEIRKIYRDTARRHFQDGHDIVIFGHTHIPDDFETVVDARRCRYLNTGDWLKSFSYVEFDGTEFYSRRHELHSDPMNNA